MKFWQDNKIFEKSLQQQEKSPVFSFYDGPPFATGLPHYGHLVASLMKDVVPRYQTMRGKYVERRWGWDCHGLPIENLIEKELGLKDKHDIAKFGVEKFCDECRSRVLQYADEWKKTIPRFGRWVDMEHPYKTMDKEYMESIWWIFKNLWDKDLIYQGHKSMHICPRCETTLSNFEVTQGYKEVTDISVTAKFELADEAGTFVLVWTTTPWTLVGNVALAIGEKIDYIRIKNLPAGEAGKELRIKENYIVAKERLESLVGNFEVIGTIKAKDLIGKKYKPLFDYYLDKEIENKENLYTIQSADFVTTAEGTGIVHIAPAFGEDDMNLGKEKKLAFIQHVKMDGTFKDEVKDFAGLEVKPKGDPKSTDKKVVEFLQAKGLVNATEEYKHSYPHCWRCDTPLLNYASTSWFVKVTEIKKKLLANNKKTSWIPEHLRDGRFGKWLEEAHDWSISRNRYWGSTLPVWKCQTDKFKVQSSKLKVEECNNIIVVGSMNELEKLSGKKINDLHKPTVDAIEFTCPKCGGTMKRIPEVLDCWFESGSMPYAQFHYPFENKEKFEKSFPAEFIAEGLDQTRGWFYTLMVLATALFNKPAFKHVVVNGIVLDKSGKKLSKKLKNYAEPKDLFDTYSADTMRFYLLTSPVMKADDLLFNDNDMRDIYRNVFMLLENILTFYKTYSHQAISLAYRQAGYKLKAISSVLDQWIVARLNELIIEVTMAMDAYDLLKAAKPIEKFINDLSTWYLRRSRERFKEGDDAGVAVFGKVLLELSKVMAPFMPFAAEYLYQNVKGQMSNVKCCESVHLEDWPVQVKSSKLKVQSDVLVNMDMVRKIVEMGLAKRAEAKIKVRQPLSKLKVQSAKLKVEYIKLIKDELNVKEVDFVKGEELKVELDTNLTKELELEGDSREFIRQINNIRKENKLTVQDRVRIFYTGDIGDMLEKFGKDIMKATLSIAIEKGEGDKEIQVNDKKIIVRVEKI
ncbi:MAG: Isoleucine-tRNA ligase [Parcubacteria group bacterium GW2011_GWA2_38_13]|nr:MAG: Isoleucine-tRNA ligase [Parcubacteria group bacterium GW2011_GWA2_38_13]